MSYVLLVPNWYFKPSRGLRQGDSLSPYLFILCAECLSSLLRKAEFDGCINGTVVAKRCPKVSHVSFASDIFIFMEVCRASCNKLKEVLLI